VRARVTAALIVTAAAAALLAAGCGGVGYSDDPANTTRGEELFVARCGSCHTLAAAGTQGVIGPNLDDGFRGARAAGMPEATVRQVVRDQIQYPIEDPSTGVPGMPGIDETLPECTDGRTGEDCVEDQDEAADDVAAYVARFAGVAGAKPGPKPGAGGTDGKALFASAGCGSCHTLADAGSSGTVGPNLDEAKPNDALVVRMVTNGGGAMPPFKDRLSEAQIAAIAKYVSGAAGK
jgi:mono/diheme cytochrome c family protein